MGWTLSGGGVDTRRLGENGCNAEEMGHFNRSIDGVDTRCTAKIGPCAHKKWGMWGAERFRKTNYVAAQRVTAHPLAPHPSGARERSRRSKALKNVETQ